MESTFKFIPDFTRHITFTENDDQPSAFLYQWMDFINNSWKYKRWQVNLRKPKGWTWDKNHVAQSYFALLNSTSLINFKVSHSQFYMPIFLTNFFFWLCGMWYLSSLPRDRNHPLHWKLGILTTGLPGKSICLLKEAINCTKIIMNTHLALLYAWCVCVLSNIPLWDPMECSPPGSSIHGISQARTMQWVVISFSTSVSYFLLNTLCIWTQNQHNDPMKKVL